MGPVINGIFWCALFFTVGQDNNTGRKKQIKIFSWGSLLPFNFDVVIGHKSFLAF